MYAGGLGGGAREIAVRDVSLDTDMLRSCFVSVVPVIIIPLPAASRRTWTSTFARGCILSADPLVILTFSGEILFRF